MKKSILLNLSLLGIGLTAAVNAGAQGTLASDAEVLGARFIVDAPAAIGGVKDFTFSSDPAGTPWGGTIPAAGFIFSPMFTIETWPVLVAIPLAKPTQPVAV